MNTAALKPVLTRSATAETTSDPSSVMTLLADYGTDGSSLTSYRSSFARGAVGAPAHFHTKASELFFVLDGSLQVLVDDTVQVLNKGDFLLVPPHIAHAFAAAPGAEADVLFVFTPGCPASTTFAFLAGSCAGKPTSRRSRTPPSSTTTTTSTAPPGTQSSRPPSSRKRRDHRYNWRQ